MQTTTRNTLRPIPYKESLKPFELAQKLLGSKLKYCKTRGYLVDGYPKTPAQVIEIGEHLKNGLDENKNIK